MNRAVLTALVSLTLAGAVRAQDTADDAKKAALLDEARQHVAKAKVHYDLGEFKEAADEYILVYRLRPIPAILFNVAQAYRQGGMYDKARQFYKSYLRESPDAKNRPMIEQSIREMDELMAKEKRTKEAAPTGVKEPAEASLPIPEKTAQKGAAPKAAPESAKPPAPVSKPVEKVAEKVAPVAPKPAVNAAGSAEQKRASAPPSAQVAIAPASSSSAATPASSSSTWTGPVRPVRAPIGATSATGLPAVRSSSHTATWITAGAAGVALAAGGVLGARTLSSRSTSEAQKANKLYGIGGGLAILSGALFLMDF